MPPESDVIRVMDEFKAALLNREAAQMDAMANRWLEMERRLAPTIELLAREMEERRAMGLPITQAALFRLERYQDLLAQIRQEWDRYAAYALDTVTTGQYVYGQLGVNHAVSSMQASAPGVPLTFRRLPTEAVQNMVGLLGNGSPLHTLLMNSAVQAEAVDAMTSALLEGTVLGRNPRKTARLMADGLARGLNQALTINRTEQIRVYRQLNRQQYAASGVVEGYYRLATRDSRVCPACLALDGQFIPLDREMAEHPNGRCAQVPKVIGFAAPTWQRGPQWLESQPASVQQSILGPGRYAAWQRGDFDLSDLATVQRSAEWGHSLQATPLKELVN